jgi:3-dehydroquinate dehydratase-2
MKALVINGPNINLLGVREPAIYGAQNFDALLALVQRAGRELGYEEVAQYQSNHEGDLVDAIQRALGTYDGIVINPAAYTHTSVAVLDALKAVGLPVVEVHISDVSQREDFRQVSYARLACFATVMGEGIEGYRTALRLLAERLRAGDGQGAPTSAPTA